MESGVWIESPFHCDYGWNIQLGGKVYFNYNCVVLDVMPVVIGSQSVIGAGSVVTKDDPDDVFAAGTPAKAIRELSNH